MTTEPIAAELSPARAEQARIVAASLASSLSRPTRLVLWSATEVAAAAADAGIPFSISIEDLSERCGLPIGLVSNRISHLMTLGWLTRIDGHWTPTVPTPRTAP